MNASFTQSGKKRKEDSKWIIPNCKDNVKLTANGHFTIHETDALMLVVPNENNHNSNKVNIRDSKMDRKRKSGNRVLNMKKSELQLACNSNEIYVISECNEVIHKVNSKKDEIEYINGVSDRYCMPDEPGDNENEMLVDSVQNKNSVDCENMVDVYEVIHSDFVSANRSNDSKLDIDLSTEDSCSDSNSINEEHDVPNQNSVHNEQDLDIHNLYKVKDENKYILHLPCYKEFFFQGKLQITLLYGEIEIFGYSLNHLNKNKTFELYSPKRCMQLCIASKLPRFSEDLIKVKKMLLSNSKLSEDDLDKLFHCFTSNDTLILVEKLFSSYLLMFDQYCDFDFFVDKEVILKGHSVEKDLGCFLVKSNVFERRNFTEGKHWRKIETNNCTIICGGKGVGKSTLLKFLINSHLSCKGTVLCIDLDPGQTEFTPPGCISAVIIKKPLLGPNFTNITTPRKMAYIGIISIASDPVKYMKAVDYIVQSCREDPELAHLPWFVNTMGFNKGIGLDLIINIIRLLQPDGLVQINSTEKSKNYEIKLVPELTGRHSVLPLLPMQKDNLDYTFYMVNSCSRMRGVGFQSGFKPAELRNFMLLSYFSPLLSVPYCSFNAIPPRWIHFSKICIAVNNLVQLNHILKAINGNLVGLCNIDKVKCKTKSVATTDSNNCFLKIAIQPEVAPCVGIGFVRGIDCSERKIYIVTPVSSGELENVNCLYLGSIDVPSCFYLKQKHVDHPVVYTDIRGIRNVRSLRHTFRYIPEIQKKEQK